MIDLAESGLADAVEYADIQSYIEDISAAITIQRYGPVWTSHDTEPTRSGENFDAAIAGAYLLRAYVSDISTIEVERLADEAASDASWISVTVVGDVSEIDIGVPPSLITNGLTARIFYYSTAGKIEYTESGDITNTSFALPVEVGAVANVIYLAAVSPAKVYYITENSNSNRVLHVYEFDGGWSSTSSDIYWPYPVHAFDAVLFETGRDLLMLATDLPPLIGSRVVGAEVTQEVNQVQGLVTFWVANGRWSDHEVIDVIDKVKTFPSRTSLRLSFHAFLPENILYGAYLRCGGTEDYPYSKAAVIRSKDGVNWEFPELIEGLTPPFIILPRTDYLYAAGIDETLRSPCCAWGGQTPEELDVTEYVVGLESSAAEIRNSQVRLSNPADVLSGTLAQEDSRLQVVYDLGYVVGGDNLRIQVSLEDLISHQQQTVLPHQGIGLATRDFLGRVNRVRSDYAAEWPNMQAGRDIFNDPSGTGYGGMRHMAPYKPSWKTPGGEEIHLVSNNKEGLAVSTFVTDALNGSAETAFQVKTDYNGEYAGIAFRAFDKDNLHFFIYDRDTDKFNLVKGIGLDLDDDDERDDTVLAIAQNVMTWALNEWYWLKVVVRYSLVYAFYSTDGITWVAVTWHDGLGGSTDPIELAGQGEWYDDSPSVLSGRFGLIGYGYSANDSPPPYEPIPWIPPIPPPPILDAPDIVFARVDDSAVWRTANWTDDPPTWVDVTGALVNINGIRVDQVNRYVLVFCNGGIYRGGVDTASPAWVRILDPLDLPVSVDIGPFGVTTWRGNNGAFRISRNGYIGLLALDVDACGCGAFYHRPVLMFMPPGGSGKGDLIVAPSDYACGPCCPVHGENYWRMWRASMSISGNRFRFGTGCGTSSANRYVHTAVADAGAAIYNMLNEGATARLIDALGDMGPSSVCRHSNAGTNVENFVFVPGSDYGTWTDVTPATGPIDRFERDANIDGHMLGGDDNYIYITTGGVFSEIVARAGLAISPGKFQYCTCYYNDPGQLFLAATTDTGTGYVLTTRNRGVTWTDKTGIMGDLDYYEIRPVWAKLL